MQTSPAITVEESRAVVVAERDSRHIETVIASASSEVRTTIRSFLRGASTFLESQDAAGRVERWSSKLCDALRGVDLSKSESMAEVTAVVANLKERFVALEIAPVKYRALLKVWVVALTLCTAVQLVIGDASVLQYCSSTWKVAFCEDMQGHFFGYMAFRYVMYGVLIGNALLASYRNAQVSFDGPSISSSLLERPALNIIVATAIGYLLARFIADGVLSFDVSGIAIQRTAKCDAGPCFDNASSLQVIGLSAAFASDIFLQRMIQGLRKSAETVFPDK